MPAVFSRKRQRAHDRVRAATSPEVAGLRGNCPIDARHVRSGSMTSCRSGRIRAVVNSSIQVILGHVRYAAYVRIALVVFRDARVIQPC
jgi:hypothetical protein